MQDYFRNRKLFVASGEIELERTPAQGCPQGSVLGLWNLVFDEILFVLGNTFGNLVKCITYADDRLVIVPGECRAELEREAARSMETLEDWASSNRFKVSPSKTQAMMMKGKLSANRRPTVRLRVGP